MYKTKPLKVSSYFIVLLTEYSENAFRNSEIINIIITTISSNVTNIYFLMIKGSCLNAGIYTSDISIITKGYEYLCPTLNQS